MNSTVPPITTKRKVGFCFSEIELTLLFIMDIILYAVKTIYMKRLDIIQNIIDIFTMNPVFSLSTCSNRMEKSSPMMTINKIPYKILWMITIILSHSLKVLQRAWPILS